MSETRKRFSVDFRQGPILQALILFAIPIFVSNIFQQLYNTVDTMIVGNVLGDTSLAAIGSCTAIYDLLVGFALGIGNGLAIVTSRSYGSKDETLLKKSVASALVIGISMSLLIAIVGTLSLKPLLGILNTPAEIVGEAYSYISFITLFTVVMFAYNLGAGLLRAIGNSIMPLVFLVASSVLNILLDTAFIVYGGMGVKGAAIATVISQGTSAILCLIYILKKTPMLIPEKAHFAYDKELYAEMFGQGLSMGLMSSIVSVGSVILQYGINGLGTLVIAGHTAARKLYMFFNMPFISFSMALSTFVSQNKGANQPKRIREGVMLAYKLDFVLMLIITVILTFAARPLVTVISGSSEAVVLDNATLYLRIVSPFYFILGILMQTRNSLQGIGKKMIPLISSIIEFFGKIAFVIIFIPMFAYKAVIFCEPVIWCVMTLQLVFAFWGDEYIKSAK